jgi:hypothetical protein
VSAKHVGEKAGAPRWESTPAPALLKWVASAGSAAVGDSAAFLAACKDDADANSGFISVNRVRALVAEHGVEYDPRRWSALWSAHTGRGKCMQKVAGGWEVAAGAPSRNDGRPYPLRRWVDPSPTRT